MSADELRHIALPQLYGAPAYARPVIQTLPVERPFDPDDLPLQAVMTDEERDLLAHGPAPRHMSEEPSADPRLSARPFSVRGLTNRLRGTSG